MKVLVAGGRDFNNRHWLYQELNKLHKESEITELIEGGARGADFLANTWAIRKKIPITSVPADWNKFKKRAGWIRNNQMADLNPDLVVLFPGGIGTKMMFDIATRRGFNILDLRNKNES